MSLGNEELNSVAYEEIIELPLLGQCPLSYLSKRKPSWSTNEDENAAMCEKYSKGKDMLDRSLARPRWTVSILQTTIHSQDQIE